MITKHTAFLVELLSFSVGTATDGWAKLTQQWHSTHANIAAAQDVVADLKKSDSTIAVAIIEWSAESPIQHGSHALRNCAFGQSQIAVYHADRTFVKTNRRYNNHGIAMSLCAYERVFVGNDWTDQPLSGKRFTGEARLTPRELPDNFKRLVISEIKDLSRAGVINFAYTEKSPLGGRTTKGRTSCKSELDFQEFFEKNKAREIQVFDKETISYSSQEQDFILNIIASGKYL